MDITVTENVVKINTISLTGLLDAFHAPQVRQQFDEMLQSGAVNFIIDLSAISFMDSAGMAVLVHLHKQTQQQQGQVVLVWPTQKAARRVIRLTRFDYVFKMAYSLTEAEQKFGL
ncbi:MAG: STAS domain-containing protein [Anaerolineae bacterium]|nr:STAS domain-containing protein [Anaerolineae bacterium]